MNANKVTCPGCGQEVEFVSTPDGLNCPQCGSPPPAAESSTKINWLVFFAVLLAPTVVALLGAMGKIEPLAVGSPLVGGGLAGIVCGIMLGRRVGRTSAARVLLGILFIGVFGCVSFILSFFGCLLGGFQMNMH
ncbi:MAG: hypothetical protein HOP33_13460 [Verrucomicrobia bacterium]|nr:hypothetical protein [Verrucomicrobiota bacterium]